MKLTYPEWVDYETKSKIHSRGWGNYQHGYHHNHCYQPAYKTNGNYNRIKTNFKQKLNSEYLKNKNSVHETSFLSIG